ncbi:hypothetical protein FDA94_38745 [Herbidospora galbida]|uniref:Uncharacterized protein n=1 Tax=Herbidospora galbida TaxID=2575442 RepID=A0A4V5UW73_9ACTN|nr:hypothetical protein [Herbidospora galbida]TKK75873.1 hypothetical protein FDA94_38745 [Herbidospora galbida]
MPEVRPTEENDDRGSVISLLERVASVVLPIGVALYAVLYLGVEEIYGVFGINPQQAGIDQSVLFSRLMSTLVLVLLLGLPLLGLLVGLAWLVNVITLGAAGRAVGWVRARPWVAGLVAALWSGATYWGFYNFFADLDLTIMVIIAVGLGMVTFLVPFQLLRRRPVGRAGLKVLVGGLTGLGLGFLLILNLSSAAQTMRDTGQANLLLSTVGFQDQWAILTNAEDDKPLYDGRWMMLLGESDGTYLLYDCDKQETFRRPMETTNLTQVQLDPEREEGFVCGSLVEETA